LISIPFLTELKTGVDSNIFFPFDQPLTPPSPPRGVYKRREGGSERSIYQFKRAQSILNWTIPTFGKVLLQNPAKDGFCSKVFKAGFRMALDTDLV